MHIKEGDESDALKKQERTSCSTGKLLSRIVCSRRRAVDVFLIRSERLAIRKAVPAELGYIAACERQEDNRDFVWQEDRAHHLAELEDPNQLLLVLEDGDGGELCGFALARINRRADSFELRRIAVHPKGRGLGTEAMKLLMQLAFEQMNIHRFWLDVYPDNHRGIALYEKLALVREGELRHSDKDEKGYRNQIIYSMLRSEYKPAP